MRLLLINFLVVLFFSGAAQKYYLFAGTYTVGKSKGIYVFEFNSQNGEVSYISNTDSASNPSFLAVSPNGKYLYAVNETGRDHPGQVSAYSFDKAKGKLSFINQQLSGGDDPCYVTTDQFGKWLIVGNYSGGNLSSFRLNDNGSIEPYSQLIQHKGNSSNKERQEKAHVHSTFFSPDYQYLLVPDLGMDKLMIYQFNQKNAQPIKPASIPFVASNAGSGPRHLTFHPNKNFVYLIEELTGTVKTFSYKNGLLVPLQTIATHPSSFKGQPGSADIHISPDGKYVYASNRGEENNLAIFSVDAVTGLLTSKGYQAINGAQPRNFMIDPSGKYLLVANQKTDNIVVFKRDVLTGLLEPTLQQINVPSPVCLQMLEK